MTGLHRFLYRRFKIAIEGLHHLVPFLLALGNAVKILLHFGSKVIVHDAREVFHQEVVDHHSNVCRQELALLRAHHLLAHLLRYLLALQNVNGIGAFCSFLVTLEDILTLLDGRDSRSIG